MTPVTVANEWKHTIISEKTHQFRTPSYTNTTTTGTYLCSYVRSRSSIFPIGLPREEHRKQPPEIGREWGQMVRSAGMDEALLSNSR